MSELNPTAKSVAKAILELEAKLAAAEAFKNAWETAHPGGQTLEEVQAQQTALRAELKATESELKALRGDKERLEWIFKELDDEVIQNKLIAVGMAFCLREDGCNDFRSAIDAARKLTAKET